MLPHCAVHMLRTISLHFSRAPLNGCGFWDGPIVFQRLHASPHPSLQQAFCGMPPLTSQPFGVTRGLGITESEITQHRLYNVPLSRFGFLPGLGTNENLQWQWPPRGIPPAGRVFLGKILGIREQLAASHVNSQSLLNTRTDYPRKQRKVNPTNAAGFLRGAFSLEKTRNVGAITASHVNLQSPRRQDALSFEKTHGIWKGFRDARFSWKKIRNPGAVGRVSYEFTVTLNARRILPEKTQGKWTQGMWQDYLEAHFRRKKTRNVGAIDRITYKFTITLNARGAFIWKTHGIWKGFRDARFSWKKIRNPGAVGRASYEFTVTLNARRILPEKTQGKWTKGMWQDYLEAHFRRKKTRNVGAIDRITYKFTITLNARGAFIWKTHGIWKGFRDARFSWKKIRNPGAVGRASYEFTITMNARRILPEKTQGIWGVGTTRIFIEKHKESAGVGHPWHINSQSKWSLGAIYTVYTTISPGLVAAWGGGVY